MPREINQHSIVPNAFAGERLDAVLAELFEDYSRSRIQTWVKSGELKVNDKKVKPNFKVAGGEYVTLNARLEEEGEWQAEPIALNIVFEDEHIMVLNKPAGLVVHPASGNWNGTLLNGLLHHDACFRLLPRAGIVHRLDKDTSGLMVVAKTLEAQTHLVEQLQARTVNRYYQALVWGEPTDSGAVEANIGRHPSVRTKMAVVKEGKPAKTHWQTLHSYFLDNQPFSHLQLKLETGRTHQIRVHMAYLGHPLVGDDVYGHEQMVKRINQQPEVSNEVSRHIVEFARQALTAVKLGLLHPASDEYMEWSIAVPDDFQEVLEMLEQETL